MRTIAAVVCLLLVATAPSCLGQLSKLSKAVSDCGTDLQLSSDITSKISETIGKHLSQLKQDSQLAQVGAAIEKDVRGLLSGAGVGDKYTAFETCVAKKVS